MGSSLYPGRAILISGADMAYFPMLESALESLDAAGCLSRLSLGLFDFGLAAEQLARLQRREVRIIKPSVKLPGSLEAKSSTCAISDFVRMELREFFPGFDVYLWFDADAWCQTPEFLEPYLFGAKRLGAAVARENGIGYRFSEVEKVWWTGRMVPFFGPVWGRYLTWRRSINIGLLALAANAPHWSDWKRRYHEAIDRTDILDVGQHAFFAAIHLDRQGAAFVPARFDWICTLSPPAWSSERALYCEPGGRYRPISVMHLAGPAKTREYDLPTTDGHTIRAVLTYPEARTLRRALPEVGNAPRSKEIGKPWAAGS